MTPDVEETLRVVHVTSFPDLGGAPFVARQIAAHSAKFGAESIVLAQVRKGAFPPPRDIVPVLTRDPSGFAYARNLGRILADEVRTASLVHSHSLWMHVHYEAARQSKRLSRPHVISPHGALEPWAMKRSTIKKLAMRALFQDRALRSAACIHALSFAEAEDLRALGLRAPIAVIPNGVQPPPAGVTRNTFDRAFPFLQDQKIVLFLGRIHPKKGVEELLAAWESLRTDLKGWTLVVAGPDQMGLSMNATAERPVVQKQVAFVGRLAGDLKHSALLAADMFVLPSFSEGFSIAVLESLAAATPVIITPHCNFPEAIEAGAAQACSPTPSSIEQAIRALADRDDRELLEMGNKGRDLVTREFTWDRIAEKHVRTYRWCCGQGERPSWLRSPHE